MKIKIGGGLYSGLPAGSMPRSAEARLLTENDARMRRLYAGTLYDDLILLQRRGYVVVWHRHPKTLSVDGRQMTVSAFKALARRERRLATSAAETKAAPSQITKAKPMSMTNPYHHETADALDAEWTTSFEAEAALCLIDAALEVEDDPHWIDELNARREIALAVMREASPPAEAEHSTASNPASLALQTWSADHDPSVSDQ